MSKNITKSKTAQGAIIQLILTVLLIVFRVDVADVDIETATVAVAALVSFGYTIYGRAKAKGPVTFGDD